MWVNFISPTPPLFAASFQFPIVLQSVMNTFCRGGGVLCIIGGGAKGSFQGAPLSLGLLLRFRILL